MSRTVTVGGIQYADPTRTVSVDQAREHFRNVARAAAILELPAKLVEQRGRFIVDKTGGGLYERVFATIQLSDGTLIGTADAFVDTGAGELLFLNRVRSGPSTLAELEQLEADRARARDEARDARDEEIRRHPREPLTLADLHGKPLPTLREAAATVLRWGSLEAKDGRLIVYAPAAKEFSGERRAMIDAARVLYAASDLVLDVLASKSRKPLPELLPDRQVLPA
jgi:hypothetical protein